MRGEQYLPKKVKFKRFHRNEHPRIRPGISIPQRLTNTCYVNVALGRMLKEMDVRRVHLHIDPENSIIGVEPTSDMSGFRVVDASKRGRAFTASLGREMAWGKYELDEELSEDNILVFKRMEIKKRYAPKDKSST